jgi:hypothetical protein
MKTIAVLLCCCVIAGPASAQATEPAPETDAPLRGPSVPESRTRTLVRKTMTGRMERLEVRPEVAALQELDLDAETAERARAVVSARTESITMLLVDELDRIKAMTDRRRDGKNDEAERMFREIWDAFEPGEPLSPLVDDLDEVLDDDRHELLASLVEEYWDARIDWELRNSPRKDEEAARGRVAQRLAYQSFQREVQQAYENSLRRYQQAIDGIANAVDPTPEQRERIRDMIIEHIKTTRLHATPEQRRETQMRIYRMLDDERKEKLFAYMTEIVIRD